MRYKTPAENWLPREQTPPFDRNRYSAVLLARAVSSWQGFCQNERDSVIAATLVTTDLARLGAPPAILGMAARVIEDEIRHVEVCTRVLDHLGANTSVTPPGGTRVARGDSPEKDTESRVARALIARFAVGEPLSAACFATARAAAREPMVAWAYTELLRDEARHGAFGAHAGGWVIRHWSAEQRQTLWSDCLHEIRSFEQRLGGPVMGVARVAIHRDTAAAALGLLSPQASCSAVVSSIPRWVLPHLARLGVVPPAANSTALLQ